MRQIYVGVVTAVAAFAFTFAAAVPEPAHAEERRIPGAGNCTGSLAGVGTAFMGGYQAGGTNNQVQCGVVSDSALSHTTATELIVYAHTSAPRTFSACAGSPFVTQMTCGPSTTSGTGHVAVTLNRSGWNAAGAVLWYPYVVGTLTGNDRIKGIWFRD
jgi:hypothetical protein